MTKKALIAMSGGVDSSVAALLMQEQGYECIGCTMRLYENRDAGLPEESGCCSLRDAEDARAVCEKLGMRHLMLNFSCDFQKYVIDRFVESYLNGVTPNPCIDCNRYLKFDRLLECAVEMGCSKIVTGHYARVTKEGEKYFLKKGLDPAKDQSYVLYDLDQDQLEHVCFPLGELTKKEVRAIAEEHRFGTAQKPDSQDICFVPNGDYARVIEIHAGKLPPCGNFVDRDGNILGRHKGIIHYTIGQRRGLGIAAPEPYYVCAINPEDNTVVLGSNADLFGDKLCADHFTWVSGEAPAKPVRCAAKIRYRQKEQPATAGIGADGSVSVVFDTPQRAITPGQTVVLYDGDCVLGGGVIRRFHAEKR